jgi:hypothetical protein
MKNPAQAKPLQSPDAQIAAFIAKFDPEIATKIRSLRTALRSQLPTAWELVYDNYNFLVFGFCSTPRASDCIVSLTANSRGVGLSFYYGSTLPDPHGLLQGSGSQNRFIRLESEATLALPEVQALISAAVDQAKSPLPAGGAGHTLVKSISAKQRPRRDPSK